MLCVACYQRVAGVAHAAGFARLLLSLVSPPTCVAVQVCSKGPHQAYEQAVDPQQGSDRAGRAMMLKIKLQPCSASQHGRPGR